MCIAIAKPEGLTIDEETLQNCWDVNPDGAGYAYVKGNKGKEEIVVNKTLDFDTFLKNYKRDEKKFKKTPFLIHFRAASVGDVNIDNCHPHIINDGQVFIHNGTIHTMKPTNTKSKDSDTVAFNELLLKDMPFGWEKNIAVKFLLENFIGGGNKVAILNKDKTFHLLNENKGVWDKGIWWSNEHYTGEYMRGQYGYARKVTEVEKERQRRKDFDDAYDRWADRTYGGSYPPDDVPHYIDDDDPSNPGQYMLPIIDESCNVVISDDTPQFNCHWCNCGFVETPNVVKLRGTHEVYEVCKSCRNELERLGGLIDVDA